MKNISQTINISEILVIGKKIFYCIECKHWDEKSTLSSHINSHLESLVISHIGTKTMGGKLTTNTIPDQATIIEHYKQYEINTIPTPDEISNAFK